MTTDTAPDDHTPGRTAADGRYVSCIVCGGGPLRTLRRYSSPRLVRCGACGLTFAGRRASDEELEQHYRGYGTRWFDSEITRTRYRELLDAFEPYRRSNRILDMGCGAGYFVEEAARRGWDAYGSEYGELARKLGRERGLQIVDAPLRPDSFPEGHFDVVTAIEVVEHLRDPIAESEIVARLVRSGGVFYCTTPNFDSLSRRLLGPRWPVIEYPEHLIYFTRPSLSRWLDRAGFTASNVTTTGLSPTTLTNAVPSSGSAPQAKAKAKVRATAPDQTLDQRLRSTIERTGALRRVKALVNRALTLLGAGDTLKGTFVRRS